MYPNRQRRGNAGRELDYARSKDVSSPSGRRNNIHVNAVATPWRGGEGKLNSSARS